LCDLFGSSSPFIRKRLPFLGLLWGKMNNKAFSKKIIQWYEENKRCLPWRETTDPYKIWLSEIILQQTRVAQGLPYYEHFVKTFPTVFSLAKAPQQQVLRLWQGLGYYSRARNLLTCAKMVVDDFGGRFPNSYQELKKLKGIGPYTAAAIASIAFKESVAVVDGNVFRVLARVFGIDKDIAGNGGKAFFFAKANELIPKDQPDLFNQAVMEFGALHCLPQNPLCDTCVFAKTCVANQQGLQKMLPVKSKKLKVRNRYFYYFVIRHQDKILMKQREGKDIWQGLYDFYLIETRRNQKVEVLMNDNKLLKGSTKISESQIYRHILSHQKLMVRFVEVKWRSSKLPSVKLKWFTKKQVAALPKPILIANYLIEE
jgi:A/G-specific adenine glycosylase